MKENLLCEKNIVEKLNLQNTKENIVNFTKLQVQYSICYAVGSWLACKGA
jgi:hypothetical protein